MFRFVLCVLTTMMIVIMSGEAVAKKFTCKSDRAPRFLSDFSFFLTVAIHPS